MTFVKAVFRTKQGPFTVSAIENKRLKPRPDPPRNWVQQVSKIFDTCLRTDLKDGLAFFNVLKTIFPETNDL